MFPTHKLNDQGLETMKNYKSAMSTAVKAVADLMPEGREKAIFATKIEEAVFFGAKAIASKPGNFSEVTDF